MSDGTKIARHYDEAKNPEGGFYGGVPLRDITEEEYETLPKHLKAAVDASDFYRKTPVPDDTDEPEKPPAKSAGKEK